MLGKGHRAASDRNQGQRGDTIVEVLICIGIVSLILMGAYATTNRSSLAIRDAQEHAEALKLAQSQLEQVRQNAASTAPAVFAQGAGNAFCMVNAAVVTTEPPCVQDAAGAATTAAPAYKLVVTRANCSVGTNCHQFTVRVEWESISTKGKANEQLTYRLHQ